MYALQKATVGSADGGRWSSGKEKRKKRTDVRSGRQGIACRQRGCVPFGKGSERTRLELMAPSSIAFCPELECEMRLYVAPSGGVSGLALHRSDALLLAKKSGIVDLKYNLKFNHMRLCLIFTCIALCYAES